MKKKFVFLLLIVVNFISIYGHAQDSRTSLTVKGMRLTIKQGNSVSVKGNVNIYSIESRRGLIHNEGNFIIMDTLYNYSDSLFLTSSNPVLSNDTTDTIQEPFGTVIFIDTAHKMITGNEPFFFHNLKSEDGSLHLNSNIKVLGEIELNQSDIYLNNKNIELFDLSDEVNIYDGKIKNGSETNDFKIFDDGDGFIKAYKVYKDSCDPANLGFEINPASDIGYLYITRFHSIDSGITDGSLKKKYKLEAGDITTYGAAKDFKFKFFDSELTDELLNNDSSLRLFYKPLHGNINKYIGGNYDTLSNFVQAPNVNFQPGYYTVADSICDNPPPINLGNDRIVCQDGEIELIADSLYSEKQQSLMTYKWYSEDPLFEEFFTPQITIISDTINKYIGDTITISLLVADERGCFNRDTVHYFIAPEPTIGIKIEKPGSNICIGDTINLGDTLAGNSTGVYEWVFKSEGYTSNNQKETFVYELFEGDKDIELSFTDTNGCATDTLIEVIVNPLPVPSFLIDENNCLGEELVIENHSGVNSSLVSSSIKNYTWDLGNGNLIEVTSDTVYSDSSLLFESDTIHMENLSPDLTYRYNQVGEYDIKLTAATFAGCVYDTSVTTFIRNSVFASFDVSDYTNVCLGEKSKFFPNEATSDTNLVSYYRWHFYDSIIITTNALDDTVSFIFNKAGKYDVEFEAVSKFGCSNSVTKTIEIFDTPNAQFTVDPVCFNNKSKFISSGSSESELNYSWRFPDTTISASPSEFLEYTFENSGNHLVTLEIEFENGCSSTFTDTAVVFKNPEAAFHLNNVCFNNQLNDTLIENLSNNAEDVNYKWDFGDGTTSWVKQPVKMYEKAGLYTVFLESTQKYIIADEGYTCSSQYTHEIEIFEIAPANFDFDETSGVCEGEKNTFSLTEFTNASSIDFYEWNLLTDTILPQGTTQLDYTFHQNGQYDITLKTHTINGCVDSITKSVEVYKTPDVQLIADSVCLGDELIFTINDPDGGVGNTYNWFLDGDYIGSSLYANTIPLVEGEYEVELEAVSAHGCSQTDTDTAVVYSLPDNEFGSQIAICSDTLMLVGEDENCTYLWNNEIVGNEYFVVNSGELNVLKTNNHTGCASSESIDVKLNSKLEVDLGADTSVCDQLVLDAGNFGASANYIWSDRSTNRYLKVKTTGEYSVTVEHSGCYAEDEIFVQVNESPVLDLGPDIEICMDDKVQIDAKIPNGVSYKWSHGVTTSMIELKQTTAGTNNYKVTVTDENGCQTKDQIKVISRPVPEIDLGEDIATCQNEEVFINATTADVSSYVWNTGETTSVIYPEVNNNNVTEKSYNVKVENSYGCINADTVSVIFYPVSEVILQDEIVACGNERVEMSAYSEDIVSYFWNNGSSDSTIIIESVTDGSGVYYVNVENIYGCLSGSNQSKVSFTEIPTFNLPEKITGCNEVELDAGNFGANFLWSDNITTQKRKVYQTGDYAVTITNGNNCSITDSVDVTINYVTKPYLGPDLQLCENDSKILRTGLHDPAYSFEWNGYSTGDTMLVTTGGTYIVKAFHTNGCSDADTIVVTERPLPDVQLGPDMYWCTGENIILDAGTDGFAYEWGSSENDEKYGRLYEVSDTGTFWVQVTNEYSCVTRDTIQIKPTSLSIDPMFVINSKLTAGDSVLFVDMSEPEPTNWLWEFGDLQQSVLQNPVHVYYGKGEYQVNLHVSNSVCTASIIKIIEVKAGNKNENGELEENILNNKFVEIQSVKIFPNPTNGNLTIEAELSARSNANLYIFDLMGRLIELRKYSKVNILNENLDIRDNPPGIYIVKIVAGTDHKTYKIVKQ